MTAPTVRVAASQFETIVLIGVNLSHHRFSNAGHAKTKQYKNAYTLIFYSDYFYITIHERSVSGNMSKEQQQQQQKDRMSEIDEHIAKRFEIHKRLGKGAYGIVWKAIDKKSRETVAVKKIFDAFRNQTDAQRTFREIMFLQSFKNHPNIIKLNVSGPL